MHEVLSSRNLFLDSSDGVGSGDNFTLELSQDSITAGDGQQLKLTLMNFNMYTNFYHVNNTNNRIVLRTESVAGGVRTTTISLTPKNYATLGQIALEFGNQLRTAALADAAAAGSTATAGGTTVQGVSTTDPQPPTTVSMSDASDRLLAVKINFNQPHLLTSFRLHCLDADGESFALLGGDRITDAASTDSSFTVGTTATELTVEGLYPMQRSTNPQIYLRTTVPSANIEMSSLNSKGPFVNHTLPSNILGVFQAQNEFIHFDSTNDEFFMVLKTKQLNHVKIFLTDRKNRPLGRLQGSASLTAAGPGTAQSTKGNLYFSAILRVDIIQSTIPKYLKAPQQKLPDQKQTGVLSVLPA